MKASEAFRAGAERLAGRNPLVAVFFGAHLLAAAALAAPVFHAMDSFSGHSAVNQDLLRGFSDLWASDFKFWNAGFIEAFRQGVARAALVFLLLNTVLMGGAIEALRRPASEGLSAFGSGCFRLLVPFLRLLVFSSVLYWLVFWIFYDLAGGLVTRYDQTALNERGVVLATWAQLALLLVALWLVNLWLDYAKVALVAAGGRSALGALGSAARCLANNFGAAAGASLRWSLVSTLLIGFYLAAVHFLPQSSMVGVVVWFVVAQGFLWLRLRLRLGFLASAVEVAGK